jgi:hypothetical protein
MTILHSFCLIKNRWFRQSQLLSILFIYFGNTYSLTTNKRCCSTLKSEFESKKYFISIFNLFIYFRDLIVCLQCKRPLKIKVLFAWERVSHFSIEVFFLAVEAEPRSTESIFLISRSSSICLKASFCMITIILDTTHRLRVSII